MKHNNQLANEHFRKQWQRRVRTWLDQAGRKKSRRVARAAKAKRVAPRPIDQLRPAVHCQTIKYNTRLRAGRGFTTEEVKAAGLTVAYARSVGIAVDERRKNKCEESLALNVQRIKSYLDRLVVFPTKKGHKNANVDDATLHAAAAANVSVRSAFAIVQDESLEAPRAATAAEKDSSAYLTLRKAWNVRRWAGFRAKKAQLAAEAEAAKK